MNKFPLFITLFLHCISIDALAKVVAKGSSEGHDFIVKEQAKLPGRIWGFDWIDDKTLLLNLRDQGIYRLKVATGKYEKQDSPEFLKNGQGGMLDLQIFKVKKQRWVYVTYSALSKARNQANTRLARAELVNHEYGSWQEIFSSNAYSYTGVHFGSRVVMGKKGYLFMSIGDRGERENGQKLSTHAGSILRLTADGKAPKDNPFTEKKGALPEIWTYGHRNPQGLAFDGSGQLWAIEHGPRGGDELNLIGPGKNYGWPVISYGKEYSSDRKVGQGTHKKGMEQPKKVYVPSIAPCGMTFYEGKLFPKWKGHLFAGALAKTHVNHLVIKNKLVLREHRLLKNLGERIRLARIGPKGRIWLATDSGRLLAMEPKP
ncbi:MAG: PQQ-dependent sugar dehydrogenase [Oligoflexales bacterium]